MLEGESSRDTSMRSHPRPRLPAAAIHPLLAGLIAMVGPGFPSHSAPAAESEKRVENRGPAGDSTARPVHSKPGGARPAPSTPPGEPGAHPDKPGHGGGDTHVTVEVTENVEVTQVIQSHTTIVLKTPPRPAPEFSVLEEVVHHTLGRRKAAGVIACSDPRNPLPAYAFVGIQPPLSPESPEGTIRLQRFQVEIEPSAERAPSILTLEAGTTAFHLPLPPAGSTSTVFPRDASGRVFVTELSVAPAGDRFRVTIEFVEATLGRAPVLRHGDGILVSINPAPAAPPTYTPPQVILVPGDGRTLSNLRLLGKSRLSGVVLPELIDLDLAASCTIVHLIPR